MFCPRLHFLSWVAILGCTRYNILADLCRKHTEKSTFVGMRRIELSYGVSVYFRILLCLVPFKIPYLTCQQRHT